MNKKIMGNSDWKVSRDIYADSSTDENSDLADDSFARDTIEDDET